MRRLLRLAVSVLAFAALPAAHAASPALAAFAATLDAQWDFGKPAESEQRFRAELARWPAGSPQALMVTTQIARTQGLRGRFADADATLDAIAKAQAAAPDLVRVRFLLERGRTLNSSGAPERAVPLFVEALALAQRDDDAYYAVDAAHMLGIAAPAPERLDWNLKALAIAEKAADPRAQRWDVSLYNNIGWTLHERGDYAAALAYWEKALAAQKTRDNPARLRIAQWTVGRGLRSVGRLDDAQAVQAALAAEQDRLGEPDGYVYEELAEIALAQGDKAAAGAWARKALALFAGEPAMESGEPARLARLAAIAAGDDPGKGKP